MSYRQWIIYVVLVLAHMMGQTYYPATPLVELTELTIQKANVECRAGCHLTSQLPTVECLGMDHRDDSKEKMMAQIGPVLFLCRPGPEVELAEHTEFVVDSLVCQFSDEAFALVIPSSCRLAYSLALSEEVSPHTSTQGADYGLRLFLSLLLVTFTILALRDFITGQARAGALPPQTIPVASQVIADPREMVETVAETATSTDRSSREERRFRQNHSAIREKSRARSRSRKRRTDVVIF